MIKNYEVSNIIRSDKNYEVLFDSNDRNGFLIAKKLN
jgi:hypothetical protein